MDITQEVVQRTKLSLFSRQLPALALLASGAFAHAASINVTNGGFESTMLTSSAQFGSTYGGQTVNGWTGDGYTLLFTPGSADTQVPPASMAP